MSTNPLKYLLTDLLPNEVPLIFNNRQLYAHISSSFDNWENIDITNERIINKSIQYTIPFKFNIRKNETEFRTISIMHPYSQIIVTKFINYYEAQIIQFLSNK